MNFVLRALTLSAFFATMASASNATKCAKNFTGFFTGLNVGTSSTTGKTSKDAGGTDLRSGGLGYLGGLHAGYGMGFGNIGYTAISIFGNVGSTKLNGGEYGSFKRTYDFGVNLDVGVLAAHNTIMGLSLGAEWARYKVSLVEIDLDPANPGTNMQPAIRKNVTKCAFKPGLFVRTFLNKNLYLGLRGTVAFGSKIKADKVEFAKNTRTLAVVGEIGYKF